MAKRTTPKKKAAPRKEKTDASVKADPTHELDMGIKPTNEVEIDEGFTPEDEVKFLQMVRENAMYAHQGWKEVYDAAREDLEFLKGGLDQWLPETITERRGENRPMMTFNDLPQYLDQVVNDQRQTGISINVAPSDDMGEGVKIMNVKAVDAIKAGQNLDEVKGAKTYDLAECMDGIIRHIETQSQADSHYDTAHQHAVEAGIGWLRVTTKYHSPTSFDLEVRISSVRNRFAVLIDPDFDEPDASDANFGFVFDVMLRSVYDRIYPNKHVGELEENTTARWGDQDTVGIAEYFERYAKKRTLLKLSSGETIWQDQHEDILDELADRGITIVRKRVVDTYCVRWWKVTAHAILEGPVELPCSTIPVVPVFGKELNVDGRSDYRGMIRHAKDAKRAENIWLTAATERIDGSPNAPWLLEEGMIEGRQKMWKDANKGTPAFLLYKRGPNGEMPQRQEPAAMPVAELQMALAMKDAVKSTIGMYNASIGAQSNEVSGKAIMARQREADVGSFTYSDNLSRAIRRLGMILVEIIPPLYDNERVVRIRHEDGSGDNVRLNTTIVDEETGKKVVVNDLAMGKFDVVTKTGPSYTTLRQEAAEALMEFMRVAPSIGALIVDKVADVMDWPGAKDIRKRLLHTLPRHMLTPAELEEVGDPPETPPSPEDQATMAKAQADMKDAEATIMMAEAKSAEAQAKLAEIQAGALKNDQMAEIAAMIEATVAEVITRAAQTPQQP